MKIMTHRHTASQNPEEGHHRIIDNYYQHRKPNTASPQRGESCLKVTRIPHQHASLKENKKNARHNSDLVDLCASIKIEESQKGKQQNLTELQVQSQVAISSFTLQYEARQKSKSTINSNRKLLFKNQEKKGKKKVEKPNFRSQTTRPGKEPQSFGHFLENKSLIESKFIKGYKTFNKVNTFKNGSISAKDQQKVCFTQDMGLERTDFDHFPEKEHLSLTTKQIESGNQKVLSRSYAKINSDKKKQMHENREMIDIVKRRDPNSARSHQRAEKMTVKSKKSPQRAMSSHQGSRNATVNGTTFKEFKPTLELKKRPSTGSPIKKRPQTGFQQKGGANSPIYSPMPADTIHSFTNRTLNLEFDLPTKPPSNAEYFEKRKKKMPMSIPFSSKEIYLKYLQMEDKNKLMDELDYRAFLIGPRTLHLEELISSSANGSFGMRNFGSARLNKKLKKSSHNQSPVDDFRPWDSKEEQNAILDISDNIQHQIGQQQINNQQSLANTADRL